MKRVTSKTYEGSAGRHPSLREILVSLSFALDLTEGAAPGHAIRSCLLAMRIARRAGVDAATTADLYDASLLKDVGCSSNAARMCQLVGGDDRAVKAGAKLQNWRAPLKPQLSAVKLLWKEVLPGSSLLHKSVRILKMAATQSQNAKELISLRCERGAQIARKLGLPPAVSRGVRHLDEHWDGGGYPHGLKGQDIPLIARLMGIAQHLDAFARVRGEQQAIDTMVERAGRWFDPDLTLAAQYLHREGHLWQQCRAEDTVEEARRAILDINPGYEEALSAYDVDSICEAFADVVDAKSPFTFRHSMRVMEAATAIGEVLGLAPARLQLVRRAALLHDVGKLGISNTILDKTGRLTRDEFEVVQLHPSYSFEILRRTSSFEEIALLAREHHERLDGSGYPDRLRADELSIESRIVATADVYGALSEARPYREALDPEQIVAIMSKDVPANLDRQCFDALQSLMANRLWYLNEATVDIRKRCALPMHHFPEVIL